MLNMRSVTSTAPTVEPAPDDRMASARIRDAAIECFTEFGITGTTARKVAARAGVSPGLVIHHFGSMQGLRTACDEHVVSVIRREKSRALRRGSALDPLAELRESDAASLSGYLARVLVDDSLAVSKLVDNLIADAEVYLREGVESGLLKPTSNTRARAGILALWSLGSLVLHQHMRRVFGVDLVDPNLAARPEEATTLVNAMLEIMTDGILVARPDAGADVAPGSRQGGAR